MGMKKAGSESALIRAACEYLSRRKHFFWRSNNMGVFDAKRGIHRSLPFGSRKGVPDICLVDSSGHFVALEGKKKGGRQSPDQKAFEADCKLYGAEYHVFYSIDDLIEIGL